MLTFFKSLARHEHGLLCSGGLVAYIGVATLLAVLISPGIVLAMIGLPMLAVVGYGIGTELL